MTKVVSIGIGHVSSVDKCILDQGLIRQNGRMHQYRHCMTNTKPSCVAIAER